MGLAEFMALGVQGSMGLGKVLDNKRKEAEQLGAIWI
jgi:hypothetical protein